MARYEEPTISGLKSARADLERQIFDLVKEFNEQWSVIVEDVSLEREYAVCHISPPPSFFSGVSIKIKI